MKRELEEEGKPKDIFETSNPDLLHESSIGENQGNKSVESPRI